MSQIENPLAKTSFSHQRNLSTGIRSVLSRRLPSSLRRQLKFFMLLPLDVVDLLLGRRKELLPPRYLNFAGDGDFEATGNEFLQYFTDLAGLKREHRVLEVGCGIGRMARPLTTYLKEGSYEGIDIVPRGIRWCQGHISTKYPNFRFQLADIKSAMYNPYGRFNPTEYRFPFGDSEFDFIFLTSVFTHMMKRDLENYLAEIARTIRPNGTSLITFFLLNNDTRQLITGGLSSLNFQFFREGSHIDDERNPDRAVAYDEEYIRALYGELGFTVETVRYGGWCGRTDSLSYQDIVVARKN